MVGRPKARARIAAELALHGITAPPPKVYARKAPSRTVATSLPGPTARPPAPAVDTVDAKFGEALAVVAAGEASGDMNDIFLELRKEAMRFALQVMRMELDPDEKSFNKLLGVKQQITTAVLTATTRIRPGDLRPSEDDGVGQLLARLKRGESLTDAEPTAEDLLN